MLVGEKCSATVYPREQWGSFHGYRCTKTPKVQREGKWYCGIHDPIRQQAIEEKKHKEWEKKFAASMEASEHKAASIEFCQGVSAETIRTFVANGETMLKWMQEKL